MKKTGLILLLVLAVLSGCSQGAVVNENRDKLRVVTSFYPMYLLAQVVTEGAEKLELVNMAQPQTGCLHDYELTISDMKLLERADVLLINGGGMENFLSQALKRFPELIIVDTSEGIVLLEEEEFLHCSKEEKCQGEDAHYGHAHNYEGNHHIWLSPAGAALQVEAIAKALAELDMAEAELFLRNAKAFHEDARALQKKASQIGIPKGEFAAVFHEGFAYITELFCMEKVFGMIADEYQIPSVKELAEAVDKAKDHEIHFFLTAEDHGEPYARILAAEVQEEIILLDPLTTEDEEGHSYLERMEKNIEAIGKHWKEATE